MTFLASVDRVVKGIAVGTDDSRGEWLQIHAKKIHPKSAAAASTACGHLPHLAVDGYGMPVMTNDHTDEDRILLQQASEGRWEAFESLMSRLEPRVLAVARRILQQQQDAEDVTQKTFVKVLQNLDQYRGDASVATWILRIATNEAISALRQRKRAKTTLIPGIAEADDDAPPHPQFIAPWRDDPVHLAQQAEIRRLIDQALNELDEKHRLVFILRDIEQLSTRETAEALGISESNVKVRLLRARLQLRERLTISLGDHAHQLTPAPHDH